MGARRSECDRRRRAVVAVVEAAVAEAAGDFRIEAVVGAAVADIPVEAEGACAAVVEGRTGGIK